MQMIPLPGPPPFPTCRGNAKLGVARRSHGPSAADLHLRSIPRPDGNGSAADLQLGSILRGTTRPDPLSGANQMPRYCIGEEHAILFLFLSEEHHASHDKYYCVNVERNAAAPKRCSPHRISQSNHGQLDANQSSSSELHGSSAVQELRTPCTVPNLAHYLGGKGFIPSLQLEYFLRTSSLCS